MADIHTLVLQTKQVHSWTWKLVDKIPDDKWLTTPSVIESNIHWQIGHLLIAHFYHIIVCQKSPLQEIFGLIPIMDYYPVFAAGTVAKNDSKISVEELKRNLIKVQAKELELFQSLTEKDLSDDLFPTQFPHPVAKTKFEAVCWDIEHTMSHCGQIALIKRVVHKRFDFK